MSAAIPTRLDVPPKPRNTLRTVLVSAAVAAFTVATCLPSIGGIELDLAAIVQHWRNGVTKLVQLAQPNLAFLPRTWAPLLETLQMALVGAVAAALCSIPLTLWAAAPTNPNRLTRALVRTVNNINRAVPDLVFATVLVAMVGVGALPGVVTLFLFNIGVVVKLVSEAIDAADHRYMEAGRAAGGTQFQINRATALPQAWPLFANQWLYALELNVRISAILGIVGAGGIGSMLSNYTNYRQWDTVGMLLIVVIAATMLMDAISGAIRRRITNGAG
ncbi:phosphonate ABC transporter, permease protein PhnE [Leucobacter chromiiresistens]|uniref:Phosphonate ABC transporter permease n=1 Tax=Leucobacter chromiiresistens TaxID=1079994 RepID=A0A147ERC5_9MICO|nr:phosphonate ABC transporter, permease protein PhnE [Leucobacter chromiiresistens]KTR86973.1 phosphonate ABC transporter permease [Leucobacter chromiiresistens]